MASPFDSIEEAIKDGPAAKAGLVRGDVLLKVGDDISTDDIMPAGARVLPFWINIPR